MRSPNRPLTPFTWLPTTFLLATLSLGGCVEIDGQPIMHEVQESSQYPSGFALRFARIHRIRDDKSPEEVDTLEMLGELYEEQFRYKGRMEQ